MKTFLIATMFAFASCGHDGGGRPAAGGEPLERVLVVGSAESPDPVLARVRELEQQGVVKDVVVMESYPVQIRMRAPRKVIDELDKIPRVGALR